MLGESSRRKDKFAVKLPRKSSQSKEVAKKEEKPQSKMIHLLIFPERTSQKSLIANYSSSLSTKIGKLERRGVMT
jgi:hypothetical protein